MGESIKSFFVALGLDVNAQSFLKGQLAVDAVRKGLTMLADAARSAFRALFDVGDVLDHADKLSKMSQTAGLSGAALQELAHAADLAGVDVDQLGNGLGFLSKTMLDAKQGSTEAVDTFRELGIAFLDSSGAIRSSDAVLMELADTFTSGVIPESEKSARAMEVFGKAGKKMVPLLNAGSAGIQELRDEANRLGIVLDDSILTGSEGANDAMNKLGKSITGIKYMIASALIPHIKGVVDRVTAWVLSNKPLLSQIGGSFLKAFQVFGKAVGFVAGVVGYLLKHWKLLTAAGLVYIGAVLIPQLPILMAVASGYLALAATAISAGLATAAAWVVASLPMLALAALAALVLLVFEDIGVWLDGGDSMIGEWLGDWQHSADAIEMMFHDALDWIEDKIKALGKAARAVADYFAGQYGEGAGKNKQTRAQFFADPRNQGNVTETGQALARVGLFDPTVVRGLASVAPSVPTVSGTAAAASRSGTVNVAPGAINVTQLPGEDGERFAERVSGAFRDLMGDMLEAAVP